VGSEQGGVQDPPQGQAPKDQAQKDQEVLPS